MEYEKNLTFFINSFFLAIFFSFLLPSFTFGNPDTLCSYDGPDLSEDFLRLTDFSVTGHSSLKEGDAITVKFKLQNFGQTDLTLGQKGIFVAARDPNNSDVSFGFTRDVTTLKVGETVSIEATKVLDKSGNWKIWPSYQIMTLKQEYKLGPDYWHSCALTASEAVVDSDQDGISDEKDNCPNIYNPDQENGDGDSLGDVCDDSDQDGVMDDKDNCPFVPNSKQEDLNKNGVGDACEQVTDSDKDGVPNQEDNCPQNYNPQQEDIDGDDIGNVCDSCDDRDSDQDGIKNCLDKCSDEPENYNQYQDDDGCPDQVPEEPKDSDGDGILDEKDKCPKEKETFNNYQDDDGCPDEKPEEKSEEKPQETQQQEDQEEKNPPKITLTLNPLKPKTGEEVTIKVKTIDQNPIDEINIIINGQTRRECVGTDYCEMEIPFFSDFEIAASAIDIYGNARAQDTSGRIVNLNFGDEDGDGELNSFDNCPNNSNSDQRDYDRDGVGDVCDDCDPHSRGEVNEESDYSWADFVDSRGCGYNDTDDGKSIYTAGQIEKEKNSEDMVCLRGPRHVEGGREVCDARQTEIIASDSCISEGWDGRDGRVRDYWLNPEVVIFSDECPYGCKDGACMCQNSDSDGGINYYSKGCFLDTGCRWGSEDHCYSNGIQLLENYRIIREEDGEESCVDISQTYNCPMGCQEGACLCQDSDGGLNYGTRGNVGTRGEDYCENKRDLVEYTVTRAGLNDCLIYPHRYPCEGSCSEGRCVPPTCDDGVQNQGEENIDCGGPCATCSLIRISGRILYEEADAYSGFNISRGFKPVRYISTTLNSGEPVRGGEISRTTTDNQGYFSFVVTRRPGESYRIEISANNFAAKVARDLDSCNEYIVWTTRPVEIPDGGNLSLGELKIGSDTNIDFEPFWWETEACSWGKPEVHHESPGRSQYFNITESMLLGYEYAWAHSGSGFNDSISQVDVQYPDSDWNNYNNAWKEITLTRPDSSENPRNLDFGFIDGTIIHEYGHHLQNELSTSDDVPDYIGGSHVMCGEIGDYETAFSEGFANYFQWLFSIIIKTQVILTLFLRRDIETETNWKMAVQIGGET